MNYISNVLGCDICSIIDFYTSNIIIYRIDENGEEHQPSHHYELLLMTFYQHENIRKLFFKRGLKINRYYCQQYDGLTDIFIYLNDDIIYNIVYIEAKKEIIINYYCEYIMKSITFPCVGLFANNGIQKYSNEAIQYVQEGGFDNIIEKPFSDKHHILAKYWKIKYIPN